MSNAKRHDASRFLSYVLRHRPDKAGLTLDASGWTPVSKLLVAAAEAGHDLTDADLIDLVKTNDKQRFALSADGQYIRASQGHPIEIELGYAPAAPPPELFHGTVARFWPSIQHEGLRPMKRQHVHLSPDVATAQNVGARRGQPLILSVDAAAMSAAGFVFYRTPNGVWLVDEVPAVFCARIVLQAL